jgi:2-dehydro-3-deoxygluconokinase
MAAEVLCIGEPMLEFNQQPPLADGRVLYAQGFGGDTSNVAVAAARQGAKAGYVSAVGCDPAGDALLALWAAEGVDSSTVRQSDAHPTGVYFVTHGPDGHRFNYHRKGSAASALTPADIPETAIAGARLVFASGISQAISDSATDAVSTPSRSRERPGWRLPMTRITGRPCGRRGGRRRSSMRRSARRISRCPVWMMRGR